MLQFGKKKHAGLCRKVIGAVTVALVGMLAAGPAFAQEKIKIVTTIGMVADLVRQVGGDRVEVEQLMGPGVDPHLYKPTSADAGRLSKADVIFYSGLMLKGRMGDLCAGSRREKVYATTEMFRKTSDRAEGSRGTTIRTSGST
jgi:manganese/zinc/iron transport system substrate-binding protein